jgi:hypothetical protein
MSAALPPYTTFDIGEGPLVTPLFHDESATGPDDQDRWTVPEQTARRAGLLNPR